MSREHPILVKPEMVRAVITCAKCGQISVKSPCIHCGSTEFIKTQTRRVIIQNNHKPPTGKFVHFLHSLGYPASEGKLWAGFGNPEDPVYVKCPYGIVGDRLWVRETHRFTALGPLRDGRCKVTCEYPADRYLTTITLDEQETKKLLARKTSRCRLMSGRYMYKSLARIWLEITNIRVERVQDISESEEDEKAEGIVVPCGWNVNSHERCTFGLLWDSLNAKRGFGWDKNPWVWVIEFKKGGE